MNSFFMALVELAKNYQVFEEINQIQKYWQHLGEVVTFVLLTTVYFQTYLGKIFAKELEWDSFFKLLLVTNCTFYYKKKVLWV